MIPSKYLEELKSAPIDHVDFVATFIEVRESLHHHLLWCLRLNLLDRCLKANTPPWEAAQLFTHALLKHN